MSDPTTGPGTEPQSAPISQEVPALFAPKKPDHTGTPIAVWGVAGLVVLLLLGVLLFVGRGKSAGSANTILPPDPYAATLPISSLAMSESANISGGKYTYIDGHLHNVGSRTVTAVTVQVIFRNEEQMPPQVETVPVFLIRTHQPYIDTQSVSAAPLQPGDDREFRLTFETIPTNWNYQMPEVHVIHVTTR